MRFEFATATRIIFGPGILSQAGALAREFGGHALVVTGRDASRAHPLLDLLKKENIRATLFAVEKEPELETVRCGLALARGERCDMVIAIGGGSALDTGKTIAVMLSNEGDVLDYLEIIGGGKALARPSVPFIAIPTTAGTGSEVTRNAVLSSPEHRVKVSLRSYFMLPKVALVDPELTHGLPRAITAATGLDALTQLIEPYVCLRANPMTDALCREGLRAARALRSACDNGRDATARESMALASVLGGLALSNSGLGAVHGLAGAIGGMFPAPHGAICGILLPHVMSANVRSGGRFQEIARLLIDRDDATAADGIEWVRGLVDHLKIPKLSSYGVTPAAFVEIIEKGKNASSMKANPVPLTRDELIGILRAAL